MDEDPLAGGTVTDVVRVGDTVRRSPDRWTAAVHGLLRHLEAAGFEGAPRVSGFDNKGREILSWIEGIPATRPWPKALLIEDGLASLAQLLRRFHDAVRSYVPPPDAEWCIGQKPVTEGEIVCHGDLGPWNTIWLEDRPFAIIDWDFAEPAPPISDVGQMAFYVVPMRDDDSCYNSGFKEIPDRSRRLHIFAEAYGDYDPQSIIEAAERYLIEDTRRVRDFGPLGIRPWAGFLSRGFAEEGVQQLEWVHENRHRLITDT